MASTKLNSNPLRGILSCILTEKCKLLQKVELSVDKPSLPMYEMKDMKKINKKMRRLVGLALVALLLLLALLGNLVGTPHEEEEATAQEVQPVVVLSEEELWEIRNANWRQDIIVFRQSFWRDYHHPLMSHSPWWVFDIDSFYDWYVLLTGVEWPRRNLDDRHIINEFNTRVTTLINQIPHLTDFEIVMGLWHAIAITNDCHLNISAPGIFNASSHPNRHTGLYVLPFIAGIAFHFEEHHSETAHPFPWPHIRSITTEFEDLELIPKQSHPITRYITEVVNYGETEKILGDN